MKRLLLLAVVTLISVTTFAQSGKFTAGLNIGYGSASDLQKPSIGIKASYDIIDLLSITPSFNYYLPKKDSYEGYETKLNVWDLNCDLHLNLIHKESLKVYPLAGVSYLNAKATVEGGGESASVSDGKFGVNLGVGAQFVIGSRFVISPEVKYQIISDLNQLVPSVALMYRF